VRPAERQRAPTTKKKFRFEDNRFSIESVVQEDFTWWETTETFVSKNEMIVDIADVTDEWWLERMCLKLTNQNCSLLEATMRHKAGQWTSHRAASALTHAFLTQVEGLHVQRGCDQIWDILDCDLSSDIKSTKCSTNNKSLRGCWIIPGWTEKAFRCLKHSCLGGGSPKA